MEELLEKIKEKFKTENKKTLENLYELVNDMINVYRRNEAELVSKLSSERYKVLELNSDLEKLQIKYDLVKKENKFLKQQNDKLNEYLEKNVGILKSINETLIAKKKGTKPSLKDLKLENMTKVSKETKAKLK